MELPPQEQALAPDGGLLAIEQMLARRAPYERVTAALDALAPGVVDLDARASIAHTRLTAASMYQRSEREISRAIDGYLAVESLLWRRLSAVLAACVHSPSLFCDHVEPLIAEAEASIETGTGASCAPDTPLGRVLTAARNARQRVLDR